MSPQPHDGPADEGLSSSIRRFVDDPERIEQLRQLLSKFNHQCRNSLNGIKLSLYLYKLELDGSMPGCLSELERTYQELERLFDWLQVIYRPLSLTLVRSPLGQLFKERLPSWRSAFVLYGRTLQLVPPAVDLPGDFDPMYLGLGLDALVTWRAEAGRAVWPARLSWGITDGFFEVTWDEGRPATSSCRQDLDDGGLQESRTNGRVDSLALPLLARILSAHGGYLETAADAALVMRLRWPQFELCEQGK